jgi:hypothetical protein
MVSSTVGSATTLWPCQPVFVHNNRGKTKRMEGHPLAARHCKRQLTQSPDAVRCDRKRLLRRIKKRKNEWCDRGVPIVFTSNDTCSNCILLASTSMCQPSSRCFVGCPALLCRRPDWLVGHPAATSSTRTLPDKEKTKKGLCGEKWRHKEENAARPCHVLITCSFYLIFQLSTSRSTTSFVLFRVMYVTEHRLAQTVQLAKLRRQSTELSR